MKTSVHAQNWERGEGEAGRRYYIQTWGGTEGGRRRGEREKRREEGRERVKIYVTRDLYWVSKDSSMFWSGKQY